MGVFDDLVPGGASEQSTGAFDDLVPKKKQNKGIIGDIGTDLKRGVEQLPGIATGLADIPVAAITGKPLVGQASDTLGGITGFAPSKWAKDAEAEYSPARVSAKTNVDQAWEENKTPFADAAGGDFTGIGQIAKSYIQNPQQLVGSVVESLPSMLAGGAISKGLIATKTLGTSAGIMAGEGSIMAGQQMDQLSQTDADPRIAAGSSALTGITGGALGLVGGKVAQKLGVIDPDVAMAGGALRGVANEAGDQTIKGAIKDGAKRVAGGAVSEGVFEELPQSLVEQGLSNFAQDKPITEGMARAGVEGTLAGSLMGGAFNALPGSKYVDSKRQPADDKPEIAGLLPAPTYTGTPGGQLVTNDAERQAAIDAADANAAAVYAARDAFEQQLRQSVTIINEPAPLQQRIDEMLGVDTSRMSKAERDDYEKSLAAAFNEPIGISHDAQQREVPFTMGEYLDAQVAAENAVRARPLKQNATQQADSRLQQVADEETNGYVAPVIPVIGSLSAVANMAVQSGAHEQTQIQQAMQAAVAKQNPAKKGESDVAGTQSTQQGTSAVVSDGNWTMGGNHNQVDSGVGQGGSAQVAAADAVYQRTIADTAQPAQMAAQAPQANAPQAAPSPVAQAPKVGEFINAPNGYRVRVNEHKAGSNLLDPSADAGALTYEVRKGNDDANPLTLVLNKDGKLVDKKSVMNSDGSSNGTAFVPPGAVSRGQLIELLQARAGTEVGSKERADIDQKISELVTGYTKKSGGNAPASQFDVSQRTDGQLAYLAENGKNGHKEAAADEIQRRGGSVQISAAPQAKTDAIAPAKTTNLADAIERTAELSGQSVDAVRKIVDSAVMSHGVDATIRSLSKKLVELEAAHAAAKANTILPAPGKRSDVTDTNVGDTKQAAVTKAETPATEDSIGWTRMTTVQRESLVARSGWAGKTRGLNLGGVRVARTAWGDMTEANKAKLIAGNQNTIKNEKPTAATVSEPTEPEAQVPIKKPSRNQIDATSDSLLMAVAKSGGMDTDELLSNGIDSNDITYETSAKVKKDGQLGKKRRMPISFGFALPLHKKGGMSFDGMREAMQQYGYLPQDATKNDAIDLFKQELAGDPVYTAQAIEFRRDQDQEEFDKQMAKEQDRIDAELAAQEIVEDETGFNDLSFDEQSLANDFAEFAFGENGKQDDNATRAGMRALGFTEEEINDELAKNSQAQRESEEITAGPGQESGAGRNGNRAEDAQARQRDDEQSNFGLDQQTNEQAAEQFAQQQDGEPTTPNKAQADRERDAVPFSLGQQSQPKPQGMQTGLFTADGRAAKDAVVQPATPEWHTKLPTKGLPITDDQRKPSGYGRVPGALADEAYAAITQNQLMNGVPMYAYYMPAANGLNGIVRLLPDDQNAAKPWVLLNGEAIRPAGQTKEQVVAKLTGWLRSAPVLGDDSIKETAKPADTADAKIDKSDDWLAELFGDPQSAEDKAINESQLAQQAQDKADRVDAAIAMLTGEIEASNAAAAEVAARNYKSNRKQIELKGDGPGKNGSLSISAINESRKRRTVEALQNASSSIKQAIEFIAENPDAAFKQVADMEAAVTKQFNEGFFGPSAKLDGQLDMAVGSLIGSGSYSGEGSAGRKLRMAAHAYFADDKPAAVDAKKEAETDDGIRYSKVSDAPAGEELVAIHNLSAENVLHAASIGGIPVPSIGITKLSSPFTDFGEITLIADKGMIDPGNSVPVFDRDAYTARFPEFNYKKVTAKKADAFYERMNVARELSDDGQSFISQLWDAVKNARVQSPKKVADLFRTYLAPRMLYAKEVLGKEIKAPMIPIKASVFFGHEKSWRDFVKNNAERKRTDEDAYNAAAAKAIKIAANEVIERKGGDAIRSVLMEEIDRYVKDSVNWNYLDRAIKSAQDFGKKRVDAVALSNRVAKIVPQDDPGYLKWVSNEISDLFVAPTITLRGKEVEASLDNIVEAMTIGKTNGAEKTMTFGVGKTSALLGKRFKSIKEIQGHRNQVVSSSRESDMKKDSEKLLEEYRLKAVEHFTHTDWKGHIDTFAGFDAAMEALAKAGKGALTDGNIASAMRSVGFKNVPSDVINLARQGIVSIREAATDYFEAKPQRAVKLNEFNGAVVPNGTNQEVIDALKASGITDIRTYKRGDEEGRKKSIALLAKKIHAQNKNTLFSNSAKSATQSEPLPRQQAERLIKSILGDKLGKVLIDSGIVSFSHQGNQYDGATFSNGNIVLNLDALNDEKIAGVLAHEGFHSTVKELIGEETYSQLMEQLEKLTAANTPWANEAKAAVPKDTKAGDVTEEIAAYAVQQHVSGAKLSPFLKRWASSFLSALRTAIIRRLPFGKLKAWAVKNVQPEDLARLAMAGLKAKARGQLQAQGREAMAYSKINQTDTPAFKKWFGDSKVVDADGKPLVVYHGTNADFSEFKTTRGGEFGPAIYFTDSPREAGEYSEAVKGVSFSAPSAHIMPMFVRIENPYTKGVDEFWKEFGGVGSDADGVERAKAAGYDGVIAKRADRYYDNDAREFVDRGNMLTHYIAFDKSQAKSAIGNNGDFDPNNQDIRYNIVGKDALSPADTAIYGMAAEGKSAEDILKFIASASRNPFYRQLAKLLMKTGIAPTITVGDGKGWKMNAGEGNKYAAGYNPTTNTVSLFRPASAERNVLHELMHSATLKALSGKGMASAQMKALYNHVKKTGKLKGMYGMSDVDEFIAEAFSNPKFQEQLKKVAAPTATGGKLSSAWDWFVRVVRGILGLKQSDESALAQALEIGVGVMRDNMRLNGIRENGNVGRMADKDTVAGTQAPTSSGDGSTGSAKAPHVAAAEQILELMDDPVYAYGLRVLPDDFTDPVNPGETVPSSFIWQDGEITDEEIDGVSTAGIRRADIDSVLAAMRNLGVTGKTGPNGHYFGSRVVLVRGDSNGSGQDVGETIIRDPEVLGEWKKQDNGLSEVTPNEPSASAGSDAIRYNAAPGKINQTDTTAFRKWFGDSKVVDANGKPMVVYHGTDSDFNVFSDSKPNFFSASKLYSTAYGKKTVPVYLSIEMPFDPANDGKARDIFNNEFRNDPLGRGAPVLKDGQSVPFQWADELFGFLYEREHIRENVEFDGIVVDEGHITGTYGEEGRKSWVPLDNYQIKSAIGNNGEFDPSNPDIRYNVADEGWSVSEPSKMDDVIYALQDKHIDTKRVMQAIMGAGKKIKDSFNPYLQEELFHGRAAKGVKDFLDFELRPLLKQMQEAKVDMGDFEEYLWNRHAEERNQQIAKINPDMQDGGSGIDTATARAYLVGLGAEQRRTFESLAAKVEAMNKASQRVLVESGLEKQSTIDAWNSAYKHYVPLQREDVDNGHVGTGKGFSVRGSSTKRAMGSGKNVVDIIANLTMQRERNIVRAEKNRVSNALMGLAVENPNKDFWTVDAAPKERVVEETAIYTVVDEGGAKLGEFTRMSEAEKLANKTPGSTIDQKWGDRVTERVVPGFKNRDNVLLTRVNGDDHYIIFNERDERAMRMATAMKNMDVDNLGRVLSLVGRATRYLSAINTQYNPVFGVINLIRDAQGALLNLSSTPLAGEQKRVMAYTKDALVGIYKDIRAHRAGLKPSSNWASLFEEFQREGGATGYRDQYANAEARAEAIKSELEQFKEGKAKQLTRGLFGWLSDYNETMENAVRLASYKAAIEKGMSKAQAASLAKNITVNFNRKGQMATQVGSLYAFFNASVQGTARIAGTLFDMKDGDIKTARLSKTGKKIVYGGIMLGSMQALLLAAAGFGDDEPPDFIKERNLILPIGDGKYLTLAMPLGYHVFPGIGRLATEFVLSGGKDPLKKIAAFGSMFAEALNPIGNSGFSLQTITPSVIDPLAALAENRDFTGKEIYQNDFNKLNPTPGFTRAKDTATAWSKAIAEGLNFITGGTDYKPGLFTPTPDQIDYLIGQVTGGVGREVGKVSQVVSATTTGEDLPIYKVPLVGRFVGDTQGKSGESAKFYNSLREINMHEAEYKGLIGDGKRQEAAEYLAENPAVKLIMLGNQSERAVKKLKEAKRNLIENDAPQEKVAAMEDQIAKSMKLFNDRVTKALAQ